MTWSVPVDAAVLDDAFRAAFAAAPPLAFPGCAADAVRDAERGWWRDVVARAFGPGAGAPGVAAAFDALFEHYARGDAWRVLPGVRDALAALRARGLRLAVVSNFDARLHPILADLGLDAAFGAVVASTEVGAAKPAAAIFQAACDALGVAPADALHVGDSLREDALGARAAGLRAAVVGSPVGPPVGPPAAVPDGVVRIADLSALPALVDAQA
jgi:putative hydrolase of the HAD superfamily